jgi:hypothetical protein
MIVLGDMRPLVTVGEIGGTEYGATAEPVTYSYITTDVYGTTKIVRRHNATNMRVRVVLPKADADAALATVQDVLDIPAAWIASSASGYGGLNVFGLGSGSLGYDGSTHSVFTINVKGFV